MLMQWLPRKLSDQLEDNYEGGIHISEDSSDFHEQRHMKLKSNVENKRLQILRSYFQLHLHSSILINIAPLPYIVRVES